MGIKDMSSSELFTEMTDTQRDDIYRMVWFSHVEDDACMYMRDFYAEEELSTDDLNSIAGDVANDFVYSGDYDCTISYWDNIEHLIERHRKK